MRGPIRRLSVFLAGAAGVLVVCLVLSGTTSATSLLSPETGSGLASPVDHITNNYTSGYGGSVTSGHVTRMHADWVIPKVVCQPSLPETQSVGQYITIQGPNPNGSGPGIALFLNTGVVCLENTSASAYYSNTAFYGGNGTEVGTSFSLALSGGDTVSATISVDPATDRVTSDLTDLTTGQGVTFSSVVFDASYVITPVWVLGGGPALAKFPVPANFTHCDYVDSGVTEPISALGGLVAMTLVDSKGRAMASPSDLSKSGTSFHVKWHRST